MNLHRSYPRAFAAVPAPADADQTVLANARIVLPSSVIEGAVTVEGGRIAAIDEGTAAPAGAIDCAGDYLLPGLIDVHTDHLEKHAKPRAGVLWEPLTAVLAYDAVVAAAGVTTVFDALVCGSCGEKDRRVLLPTSVAAMDAARDAGLLAVDHWLHLRCDVTEPGLPEVARPWLDHPRLRFVTMMDSSPARDPALFRRVQRYKRLPEGEIEERLALPDDGTTSRNRRHVVAECRARGLPLAPHDETTQAHIDEALELGLGIIEFPLALEAALAARDAGLTVIAGAPNLINGGSYIGNVSAAELIRHGAVSVLCSDYVPASLLSAVFWLAAREELGLDLPAALRMVTLNPADLFGFADRGAIASGRRADLVRVRLLDGTPVVVGSWRAPDPSAPGGTP